MGQKRDESSSRERRDLTDSPVAPSSLEAMMPRVYDEVRRIARRELRREATGHTLSTTALAHEAYLELAKIKSSDAWSRARLLALCAQVIRNVLVDYAVRRKAQKRGGGQRPVTLENARAPIAEAPELWADLDEALRRLAERSPRQAKVVECRFFAGMSVEATAEALDIAPATVKRDWSVARAWLNRELTG
jgi:RNA polymerase sigma factor (TIGR02999 family)